MTCISCSLASEFRLVSEHAWRLANPFRVGDCPSVNSIVTCVLHAQLDAGNVGINSFNDCLTVLQRRRELSLHEAFQALRAWWVTVMFWHFELLFLPLFSMACHVMCLVISFFVIWSNFWRPLNTEVFLVSFCLRFPSSWCGSCNCRNFIFVL